MYAKRVILLKQFVENFGLSVDADRQEVLNDLMNDADSAQQLNKFRESVAALADAFIIESNVDEWGYRTYKLTMTNTTDMTFDYFYMDVSVLDQSGAIIDSGSTGQVTSWSPGQMATTDMFMNNSYSPDEYTFRYTMHYQAGAYYE